MEQRRFLASSAVSNSLYLQILVRGLRTSCPKDSSLDLAEGKGSDHYLTSWADIVMEVYLRTFDQDDDKNTVAQTCESLAAVLRSIGLPGIEPCELLSVQLAHLSYSSSGRLRCLIGARFSQTHLLKIRW